MFKLKFIIHQNMNIPTSKYKVDNKKYNNLT